LTSAPRRVGVFGGTFDPVHLGHLVMAEEAREALALDEVLFVPARQSPLKHALPAAPDTDRLAMLARAIAGNPAFSAHTVDLDRPGPSFTVDTLARLRAAYGPQPEFWLILGLDSLARLPAWRRPDEIVRQARLAVLNRPGTAIDLDALVSAIPGLEGRIDRVAAPLIGISATDLRRRVAAGRSIRYQVPDAVADHIHARGLYGPYDPGQ